MRIALMICIWLLFVQRANDLVRNKIHPTSIISGFRVSTISIFCSLLSHFDLTCFNASPTLPKKNHCSFMYNKCSSSSACYEGSVQICWWETCSEGMCPCYLAHIHISFVCVAGIFYLVLFLFFPPDVHLFCRTFQYSWSELELILIAVFNILSVCGTVTSLLFDFWALYWCCSFYLKESYVMCAFGGEVEYVWTSLNPTPTQSIIVVIWGCC